MNDIISDLFSLALKEGIEVETTDKLSPQTPAACDTETRRIVINTNYYNQNQLPLQIAHEIGHIINGDHSKEVLYFTPTKNKIEVDANTTAINLLVPYYLNDRPDDYVSVDEFMEMFVIPEHLRYVAVEVLNAKF